MDLIRCKACGYVEKTVSMPNVLLLTIKKVFLTSVNFTEAAHQRNIETGLILEDEMIANKIMSQVNLLIKDKILFKVLGI